MCGINGIYGLEKLQDLLKIIHRMNEAIAHRGPDASGTFHSKNVVLGHQRLKIIDLSESANQPFHSSNGRYTLVFNGEIYNYQQIRKELEEDFVFRTNSDTEVLLNAFTKWGKSCLQKLNGMFAFAIWDDEVESLFLARDRMGIKPLYYAFQDGTFVFSSEVKAVLRSGLVKREFNQNSLYEYLNYQTVYGENTILDDVKMIPPASWITIQDNQIETGEYWQIEAPKNRTYSSFEELKVQIAEKFGESIQKRMIADVPFGAFLSGGIDSSIVVGNMAKFGSQPIKTFHISFAEEQFSESKYAKIVSNKFGTEHTDIQLHPNDLLNQLPDALSAMDHPSGDGPNTWLVSKVTKEAGITMVHSGLGGDELFAGYPVFRQLSSLIEKKYLLSFPKFLRKLGGSTLKGIKGNVEAEKIAEILTLDRFDLESSYPISRKMLSDNQLRQYFGSVKFQNGAKGYVQNHLSFGQLGFELPYLSKISVAELRTYLISTLLRDTDQMSMAHALEVRVPFLDHEFVELLLSVPDEWKMGSSQKQLLVNSFKGLIPDEVINRPKMGFVFPWEVWMKNELKQFCGDNLAFLDNQQQFKKGSIANFSNQFFKGNPTVTWSRIWPLVVLGYWIKNNG
jgi:asparagine synthase (glutamine-hydrolysing)